MPKTTPKPDLLWSIQHSNAFHKIRGVGFRARFKNESAGHAYTYEDLNQVDPRYMKVLDAIQNNKRLFPQKVTPQGIADVLKACAFHWNTSEHKTYPIFGYRCGVTKFYGVRNPDSPKDQTLVMVDTYTIKTLPCGTEFACDLKLRANLMIMHEDIECWFPGSISKLKAGFLMGLDEEQLTLLAFGESNNKTDVALPIDLTF